MIREILQQSKMAHYTLWKSQKPAITPSIQAGFSTQIVASWTGYT